MSLVVLIFALYGKMQPPQQPHMMYTSVTTNWSSTPRNGKIYGTRNVVTIKNGKGTKTREALNAHGHVVEHKTRKLKRAEMEKITQGQFVPGLWRNCGLRSCTRKGNRV